ncbi:hypothetical protein BVRB_013520 [Beta vulgaris subsp. vulgaris]|uniref:Uncharacterized protein n=1 Tax=Beta vulgaris subsp. vulgaris TaxID=3555 RepID=A0A0J8B567_BETVV|nr:hypothetical protein BVRB_013520 [Beta vulgaris subsp. vulgaris]
MMNGHGKKLTIIYMRKEPLIILSYHQALVHQYVLLSADIGLCLHLLLECRDIPILGV